VPPARRPAAPRSDFDDLIERSSVQAPCPNCANRIVVDDSRVPDRAFSVRCPKCQAMVKFPGRTAAAGSDTAPTPPPPTPPRAPEPQQAAAPEKLGEHTMAHLRRELAEAGRAKGQVLVALSDRALAGSLTLPLSRIGYAAEALDSPDDAARRLEQGLYDVVITTQEGSGASSRGETLYQRIGRLGPEARRNIFLVLVGDEFRTGDGKQAFIALADLVVNPRDASAVEPVLLTSIAERNRLYQTFLDARRRFEAAN
jgi:predicted Zn finger-like uncharacterized protein